MNSIVLSCTWKLEGPLHAGTGLSRGGGADRLIRRDQAGKPFIPGDSVKGTLRMSAERLLRWLHPDFARKEEKLKSLPTHSALIRVFNSNEHDVFYRFAPAAAVHRNEPFHISSTAMDRESRTARSETLRTIEASSRLDEFSVRISGEGGDWSEAGSRDSLDGLLLAAALLAADSIGGKRGSGYGRLLVSDYAAEGCSWPDLSNCDTILALQRHLRNDQLREKC